MDKLVFGVKNSLPRASALNFSKKKVNCQSKFQFARLNSGFNEKQTKG